MNTKLAWVETQGSKTVMATEFSIRQPYENYVRNACLKCPRTFTKWLCSKTPERLPKLLIQDTERGTKAERSSLEIISLNLINGLGLQGTSEVEVIKVLISSKTNVRPEMGKLTYYDQAQTGKDFTCRLLCRIYCSWVPGRVTTETERCNITQPFWSCLILGVLSLKIYLNPSGSPLHLSIITTLRVQTTFDSPASTWFSRPAVPMVWVFYPGRTGDDQHRWGRSRWERWK